MIRPFGERALLVELDGPGPAQTLAGRLRSEPIAGVGELVPGLRSLLVELGPVVDVAEVAHALEDLLESVAGVELPAGRVRTIPVIYGGEHGPDLGQVADGAGLTIDEVAARHTAAEHRVLFLGFAPGFAYLGGLPEELDVRRLSTPRTRTPAGSVAVADGMSGIYPAPLPGGWRVIGRTPITLFDSRREPPAYLAPGDSVRFEAIAVERWEELAGPPSDWA